MCICASKRVSVPFSIRLLMLLKSSKSLSLSSFCLACSRQGSGAAGGADGAVVVVVMLKRTLMNTAEEHLQ